VADLILTHSISSFALCSVLFRDSCVYVCDLFGLCVCVCVCVSLLHYNVCTWHLCTYQQVSNEYGIWQNMI